MEKIPLINSDKFALIDDEDFEEISGYRWRYSALYARAHLYCHAKKGMVVIAMIEAALAYNRKARELFGEFARLNVI